MAHVLILGGGLAGLSSALALGQAGHQVTVLESRPNLGGRATSYALSDGTRIDNCQHILLACCVNLRDFYRRLGVESLVTFHKEFHYIEPGGRTSLLRAGVLPAPLHFTESFAGLRFLSLTDKLRIAQAILAIRSEHGRRSDLDRITMLDWLREKRQTPRAIERFWRQVLVSAINEELDVMAAGHGFQVFFLGFLAASDSYRMGVPDVPLGDLCAPERFETLPNISLRLRSAVRAIHCEHDGVSAVETDNGTLRADHYISALPCAAIAQLAPGLGIDASAFAYSPITGIHLWFDRPVVNLPHATLLDRTIHWVYSKDGGRYLQLVVSASRSLVPMPRQAVVDLALRELAEFFPAVASARLKKAHVVKELKATFSARTGLDALRPAAATRWSNLSLAGDWTRSGWPATMEGAVRSGYLAAEAATVAIGEPAHFLLPDIA